MAKFNKTSDGKKGGLFVGKSHDDGGIPAVVVDTGQPIEVEGGEAIINKEATKKYCAELSEINQSAGNGVPIPCPDEVEAITNKFETGGKITQKEKKQVYDKWKKLVNMTYSELKRYMITKEGKESGLSKEEANEQGISSGRESAEWILKMKKTNWKNWSNDMWRWAGKQINFISRMRGNKGDLFDAKGKKTRKLMSLLIWGHNPKKFREPIFNDGGTTPVKTKSKKIEFKNNIDYNKYISEEDPELLEDAKKRISVFAKYLKFDRVEGKYTWEAPIDSEGNADIAYEKYYLQDTLVLSTDQSWDQPNFENDKIKETIQIYPDSNNDQYEIAYVWTGYDRIDIKDFEKQVKKIFTSKKVKEILKDNVYSAVVSVEGYEEYSEEFNTEEQARNGIQNIKANTEFQVVKGEVAVSDRIERENVIEKFKGGGKPDETELIAIHNIQSSNIIDADKLGGLITPSIAIIKPEMDFNQFGMVTLIANKELIDPKDKWNVKVFAGDVYSPSVPLKRYYYDKKEADRFALEVGRKAYKKYASLGNIVDNQVGAYSNFYKDLGKRSSEELQKEYFNTFQIAYLLVKNIDFKVPEKYITVYMWNNVPFVLNSSEIKEAKKVYEDYRKNDYNYGGTELEQKFYDILLVSINNFINEQETKREDKDEKLRVFLKESIMETFEKIVGTRDGVRHDSIYRLGKYLYPQKDLDKQKLEQNVKKAIKPYLNDYKEWLEDFMDQWQGASYFEQGKEKRGWTMDNLVDATTGKTRGQEGTATYGLNKARSFAFKQFSSIDEMKAKANNLLDANEVNKIQDEQKDRFFELAEKVKYQYSSQWDKLDDFSRAFADYFKGKSMASALSKNGFSNYDWAIDEIKELADEIKNSPVDYFEAKLQRGVKLSEFKYAVVPKGFDKQAIEVLKKNGIKISYYTTNEERTELVAEITKKKKLRFEEGGLVANEKEMDVIIPLLKNSFDYLGNDLEFIGRGLMGSAFVTVIDNDLYVVKYTRSITEFWLTQMALVSNPPHIVTIKDVKKLSDNYEYGIIHKYTDNDALPNKAVWNVAVGIKTKEYLEKLHTVPEKEKLYVKKLAQQYQNEIENYFGGFAIDVQSANWGYEDGKLVLFDLDGNVNKYQFEQWMQKHGAVAKFHLGGDMKKHLAPNGKPSNLTHEQWHLVRTPEFFGWFGFWNLFNYSKSNDYYDPKIREISKQLKEENELAIQVASDFLMRQVTENDVLISMPSRSGCPTDTKKLAEAIAKKTGAKVFNCLTGDKRKSIYDLKKSGENVSKFNFGFHIQDDIPKGQKYFIVDNVIGTGTTMKNAMQTVKSVVGENVFPLVYAIDLNNISKVVDENGEPLVVYHGTPSATFTEFQSGLNFFTPNKKYADNYQSSIASSRTYNKQRTKEGTYTAFLNIKNPFDPRNNRKSKELVQQFFKDTSTEWMALTQSLTEKGLMEWIDVDNFDEWLLENNINLFDGYVVDETSILDEKGNVQWRGVAYVTTMPKQIKLADGSNTTFDQNNPDIRFQYGGQVDLFGKTVYVAGGVNEPVSAVSEPVSFVSEPVNAVSTPPKDVYESGNLQVRNVGGDYVYYKRVNKRWEFLTDDELAELKIGQKHEMEHNTTMKSFMRSDIPKEVIASSIAWEHIQETPDYYEKLEKAIPEKKAKGDLIKRADGSYSQTGLWDNIRANAGSRKKPTKEMLEQEQKIKAESKKENGGSLELFDGGGKTTAMEKISKGLITKYEDTPVNYRNVKAVRPETFIVSPYDKKFYAIFKAYLSDDSLRPILSAIHFDKNQAIVTDAHKLLHVVSDKSEFDGNYPTEITFKKAMKGEGEQQVLNTIKESKFPAWASVVRDNSKHTFEIDSMKLYQYVKTAINYCNRTTYQVAFRYGSGNDELIGFNARFLIEVLESLMKIQKCPKLYCHIETSSGAILISFKKSFSKTGDTYALLMPVMLMKEYTLENRMLGAWDLDTNTGLGAYFDFSKNEIFNSDGTVAKYQETYDQGNEMPSGLIAMFKGIINPRVSIPVFENLCIRSGEITAMNLDDPMFYVQATNDYNLPDGIYAIVNNGLQYNVSHAIDEFPIKPLVDDSIDTSKNPSFTIRTEVLKYLFSQAVKHIGDDDLRPIMKSVVIHKTSNQVRVVSTDAHTMCVLNATKYFELKGETKQDFQILFPHSKKILNFLKSVDTHELKIYFNETSFSIVAGRLKYTGQQQDGKYPNYEQVIPNQWEKRAVIDTKELMSCIQSEALKKYGKDNSLKLSDIKVFNIDKKIYIDEANSTDPSPKQICSVDMNVNSDGGTIGAIDSLVLIMPFTSRVYTQNTYQSQYQEKQEIKSELEPTDFMFKADLLLRVLQTVGSDKLNMYYSNLNRAFVVLSKTLDYENSDVYKPVKTKSETVYTAKPKTKVVHVAKPQPKVVHVAKPKTQKGVKPKFKIGDTVKVNYGEMNGSVGKVTKVYYYDAYPESMKPDDIPYYEIGVGKEISESNLEKYVPEKKKETAKDQFISVGKKFKLPNNEIIEIIRLFNEEKGAEKDWVEYKRNGKKEENSVKSLRIFLKNWKAIEFTESKKEVKTTDKDLRDALAGAKAFLKYASGKEKSDMQDYIRGLEILLK